MREGLKVVVIGGGSSYTPELIEGFLKRVDELPVREICLVDCEEGKYKLDIIKKLTERMLRKKNANIKLKATLNRREVLKDADFVVTQLRVGLLEARIKDERIPLSHGLFGQETNGAGGLFKALRTIPVILDICKDMEELCKDAWLINFTNPAGIVTEAIYRYSNIKKAIGLCNVPIDMHKEIARLLNVETKEVEVHIGGLNHMSYATGIYLNGEDKLDFILEKWGKQTMQNIKSRDWNIEFLKGLGAVPSPYHRYYYMAKENLEDAIEKYKEHGTRAETVKKIEEELFEIYKDENLDEKPKLLEKRGGAYYSEAACNLIASLYNDKGDIQVVNTKNNGMVNGLEKDDIVEISAKITKNGPVPVKIKAIPEMPLSLVKQMKGFEIATCKAAVSGEYKDALLAMVSNPLVFSQRDGIKVLDELLEAHKGYLPQFNK